MDGETQAAIDLAVEGDEQLLREALEALKAMMKHDIGHGLECDECMQALAPITKLEERLLEE